MGAAHGRFGRIDVLINSVGGTIWAEPLEHYRSEEIEAEVRRSLFSTLWCCHAVPPYMIEPGSGAIVNVSSVTTPWPCRCVARLGCAGLMLNAVA